MPQIVLGVNVLTALTNEQKSNNLNVFDIMWPLIIMKLCP